MVGNVSFWVDEHGGADDSQALASVHVFLPPGAVCFHNPMLRVAEELYLQLVFPDEGPVTFCIIGTASEDHGIKRLELRQAVGKFTCLGNAARRIVSRVEVQHDPFAE